MKKEKLSTFFKGKGFYAALAVGAVSLFAVGIINSNTISNDNNNVTQNPSTQVAENTQPGEDTEKITNGVKENAGETAPDSTKQKVPENTGKDTNNSANNNAGTKTDTAAPSQNEKSKKNDEISDLVEPETDVSVPEVQEEAQTQLNQEDMTAEVLSADSQISNLAFNEEEGLVWPVQGEILLNYSMEKPIFFQTLAQYKCNSAMVIEAKEGTEVFSAAKAVITNIVTDDETGVTITANIGNDYEVIYGQVADVQVKVGDVVEKGELLGVVAAPTKYYVEEGSNLYFKVLEGGEPVNPLLLLN